MNPKIEQAFDAVEQKNWSQLKLRRKAARLSLIFLVPVVVVTQMLFDQGAFIFIAFTICVLFSIFLRLRAIYTPCPASGWAFGAADFKYSSRPRWSLIPSNYCRHCGAMEPHDG